MSERYELGDSLSIKQTGGEVVFYNHGTALLSLSTEQAAALRKVLNDLSRQRKDLTGTEGNG